MKSEPFTYDQSTALILVKKSNSLTNTEENTLSLAEVSNSDIMGSRRPPFDTGEVKGKLKMSRKSTAKWQLGIGMR